MIITIIGEVDSGKTTFLNTFIQKTKIQKYGRTESISCYKGLIGATEAYFLDCPGHAALAGHNVEALTIADVVFYIVDSNAPFCRNELLQVIIKKYKKPLIIIANKFQNNQLIQNRSLKQMCNSKEHIKNLSKSLYELCAQLDNENVEILPFLDLLYNSYGGAYMYPLSLKTGFGMEQFINFFNKVLVPRIPHCKRPYLYMVSAQEKAHYKNLGAVEKNLRLFSGKTEYKLHQVFTYNHLLNTWIIKKEYEDTFKTHILPLYYQNEEPPETPLVEDELVPTVNNLFDDPLLEGPLLLYSTDKTKLKLVEEALKIRVIEHETVKTTSLKQFLGVPSLYLKIGLSESTYVNFKKNIIITDSIFELQRNLKLYFKEKQQKKVEGYIKELSSISIIESMPNCLFKNTKEEIVIGATILQGQIKKTQYKVKGYNNLIVIKGIQKNNASINAHSDIKVPVAIKLEVTESLCLDHPLIFYDLKCDEILETYNTFKIKPPQLVQKYLKIQSFFSCA